MRARVLIPFIDRETGFFYRDGEVVDLEQSRIAEIAAAGGFLQPLDDPAPAVKKRATRAKRKG